MPETYITTGQLAHMRTAVAPIYMDVCQRLVFNEGSGGYGYGSDAYTPGESIICLFVAKPKPDVLAGTEILQIDADIYLPRLTVLLPNDHIKITYVQGETTEDSVLGDQEFAIVAGPMVDMVTMQAGLRLLVR